MKCLSRIAGTAAVLSFAGCGDDHSITGMDSLPPLAISDLSAVPVGPSSVRLTWTSPSDAGGTGAVVRYVVRVAPYPFSAMNYLAADSVAVPPNPVLAGHRQEFIVRTPYRDVRYHFEIESLDAAGNRSPPSNIDTVSTQGVAAIQTVPVERGHWGEAGTLDGQLGRRALLTLHSSGNLIVGDPDNERVQVFDADGHWIRSWEAGPHLFEVGSDAEGRVLTLGQFSNVRAFQFDGTPAGGWGTPGPYENQAICIGAAVFCRDGSVVIAEHRRQATLARYDLQGHLLGRTAAADSACQSPFLRATEAPDGRILVINSPKFEVLVYRADLRLQRRWTIPGAGDGQSHFFTAIATDPDGYVYVADPPQGNVLVFSADGRQVYEWRGRIARPTAYDLEYIPARNSLFLAEIADPILGGSSGVREFGWTGR